MTTSGGPHILANNCRMHTRIVGRKRRSFPYTSGGVVFTLISSALPSHQSLHELGKLQQIRQPQQRTTASDDDLGIGRDNVGPLPRHRANDIFVYAEQEPRAVPIVPFADAHELPPAERVERMRHAHKTRRRDRRACILS